MAASTRFTPTSSLLDQQPTITDAAQLPPRGRSATLQTSQSIASVPRQGAVIGRQRVQGALGRGQTTDTASTSVRADFLRQLRENEPELQNVAKVYAYLEVSIIRLSDNVTMYIRTNFVKTLSVEIENALKEKLKNMKKADYERYGADDPVHASDRAEKVNSDDRDALAGIAEAKFS